MKRRDLLTVLALTPLGAVAACDGATGGGDKPSIVVTTNILGDVVTQVVGDQVSVTTLMAPNADPHSFGVSAKQTLTMRDAALLVTNGLGLEEGLASNIESAKRDGVTLLNAGEQFTPIEYSSDDASGPDPHFWTDPTRMIDVVNGLEGALGKVPGIDASALAASATAYRDKLAAADERMSTRFSTIPEDKRALVTNHHVFGYLAARYGFRLIGAVIPGGSTLAAPSASDLEELSTAVREAGVGAIFADTSHSDQLITALKESTGQDIQVVALYTESLSAPDGDAPTYLDMLSVNTDRITAALTA
ncbi:metal ABC transporter substrate-binding protein [Actinomyces gaoshouyii]|uniref:ABC transporter substrate-binding protein n=1 Tax=Actinomyces gaoshouyii TaxID=1960083 RepID=A0A8H9HBE8_9ACTO|nr:metal ABC transporter substrate-binding protein [Actinomyces gaoshouyii]ARD42281.1 zinc ABC transporter substrate-binding protein [Actinomyces gaoshouyii]GGO95975.1 ABC transporter substrate-binding protein [Actinomyces gaoshouyii]